MTHALRTALAVAVALTFVMGVEVPGGLAAEPTWVPFVLPWDDAAPGPTDLSGLNHVPAGRFGPITATPEGHFQAGGQRIRFMGVNLCFAGTLPEKDAADKIAARMAKFGVNAVRFHHMDAGFFPGGLIRPRSQRSGDLDGEALDRLGFFISRLKARGIYANINLLVSRRFRSGDGLPREIDALDTKLRHAIAIYHPAMIDLQKQYARDLLGWRNPHTGLTLAADPAVAFVEINNENGLLQKYFEGDFDDLPAPFAEELARQWNAWLKRAYADTPAMRRAWRALSEPPGGEMLSPLVPGQGLGAWNLERHAGSAGELRIEENVAGQPVALRADVRRLGRESWHVQLTHPGLKIIAGKPYTLVFRGRADPPRSVTVAVQQDHDPWSTLVPDRRVQLTREWREHRFTFTASSDDDRARVRFGELGRETGSLWLAAPSLRSGGQIGPAPAETLERASVPIIARSGGRAWPEPARRDFLRFLRDAEADYWRTLRRFVKQDLGFRGIVMGTIVACSPPTVQAEFDAVDGHAYWQHPHFPRRPWDPEDWIVRNVSMVNEAGGVLANLSMQRVAGKPYTVTEYNHPSPNSFGSEGPLLLAAQAAFQDWDGIFLFAYSHNARWDAGHFDSFFDIGQHPTKMANFAAAALIFRTGQVSPGRELVTGDLTVDRELDILARTQRAWNMLGLADLGVAPTTPLLHRTAIRIMDPPRDRKGVESNQPSGPAPDGRGPERASRFVSDTGEIEWDRRQRDRGVVTINAPRVKAAIGFFGDRAVSLGPVTFAPADGAPPLWRTLCLSLIEGESFSAPGRALLVATGDAENTGMVWKDAERSSVGRQWGQAPSRVEVIPAVIRLPVPPNRLEAWPLDERGRRTDALPARPADGGSLITLGQPPTLWYEIVTR
ncbi:MAG: hypothetical protein AMXMBFR83_20990 [Phycisphaerae bacterium]